MNNFHISEDGVAYYILTNEDLEHIKIDSDDAKSYLYLFNYCDEILVWCSFSEDIRSGNYRASIRSRDITINRVAARYGGGGHRVAAGARPKNLDEIYKLVADLGKEIRKTRK